MKEPEADGVPACPGAFPAAALLLLLSASCGMATSTDHGVSREPRGEPALWVCPPPGYYEPGEGWADGVPFKSLFRPDSAACWEEARGVIDLLSGLDSPLRLRPEWEDPYGANVMVAAFDSLESWGLPFAIETTCLHSLYRTGQEAFDHFSGHWTILESWGADITRFTVDEPFRRMDELQDPPGLDYSAHEVAVYIQLVREHFGGQFVLMEPYPYFSVEEIEDILEHLGAELAGMGEPQIYGFALDPDWRLFPGGTGSWEEVREIEEYCRSEGISFCLVCWASPAGNTDAAVDDGSRDRLWHDQVLEQGLQYREAGGAPDEYFISSWLWIPRAVADENSPYSFMRTVLDFYYSCVHDPGGSSSRGR